MRDKVFISYAHADQEEVDWMKKLKKHLSFFEIKKILNIWEDSRLHTGGNSQQEIIDAINDSKIAVLLVGPAFLGSAFINGVELPRILEAAKSDGLRIFPLITNFCAYKKSELKDIWAFNDVIRPLELLSPSEQNRIISSFCTALEEAYSQEKVPVLGIAEGMKTAILPGRRLTCCDFSAYRDQFVCAGFEDGIMNINHVSGIFETLSSISSIARTIFRFPNSSVYLIGFDNGEIYSFNFALTHFKKCFDCRSSVFSISLNAESKALVTTEKHGEIIEWTVKNLQEIVDDDDLPQIEFQREIGKHTSNAFMFTFMPSLNQGISVGADGQVLTVDFKSGKIRTDNSYKAFPLYCVAAAENGTVAIGAARGKIFIVDQHFRRSELTIHADTVRALAITPNAKWLFTGSKDKSVKVVHLESKRSWIISKGKDYIYDLKFSRDHNQVIACDGSGALIILDFNRPIEVMTEDDMDFFINTSLKL